MPTFFQRPENALKRAKEFIEVGKKQRALDALYDVIKSKKHRTWQKIHEPIMELYLELCVELKKSHVAKEGLYQYKNICQQVNIKSLEDVVRKYLEMADKKTDEAKKESHLATIDVDDLDVIQTPENLLLSAVSGEDTQDRTDRAILTPWVKFLWESYRQCLDLLRNNSSVEKLYQDIAQQAFKFCLTYERKTEFRKLCDNLRTHLGHIYKHQHQQRAINLNNPESQAMHLETRLVQLDSAIQMELWQEAFKAVEDIHGLISLSKKAPKPALMANYYNKLGLVFWKSGNHMFHACAWHRLYHLSREQRKNLSGDDLAKLSSRVMCATLAIPIPASHSKIDQMLDQDETTMEKKRRLSTLLGLPNPPDRATLIKDLVKYNIVNHVYPEISNLYKWLEVEFHPLKLASRVQSSLDFLQTKDELSQYVSALQDITITRLLKQVSQVYQTIEFSRLAALAPFASQFHIERIVVNAAKNLDLQVRIDHRKRMLSFGTDLGVAQKEDCPEGPYLQNMPSEQIRNQLASMANALGKAVQLIKPAAVYMKNDELKMQIINNYRMTARKDHFRILQRRQIIEDRKEELENLNTMREREEMELLEEQRRRQVEAEQARLQREAEEREKVRRSQERREIQLKAAKEKLDQLRSTTVGAKVFSNMDEELLADMDTDEIMQKQVEQLEKEKREMQERLRTQEKKIDYFERAKRQEEMPLLQEQGKLEAIKAREFWEQQEQQRIEQLKVERQQALVHRDRLQRMKEEKEAFLGKLKEARISVYKEKLDDFEKRLIEEKKKRLAERKEKRKEERKAKWYREKEEEEQRKRDEEMKRIREEEEQAAEEQRQKEEAEYAERLKKLEEQAEKQRQREREIEEREKKRREETSSGGRDEGRRDDRMKEDGPWRRGGDRGGDRDRDRDSVDRRDEDTDKKWRPQPKEGGWREREKEREDSWRKKEDDRDRDSAPPTRGDRDGGGGGGAWRRGGDREDRDRGGDRWGRDRDERPRDEERPRWGRDREDRPSPREDRWGRDDRGGPRDRDDRAPRDRDERGPPRDRDDRGPRDRDEPWGRRAPPRDDDRGSGWRDRERDGGAPPRGGDRGGDRWGSRGGDRERGRDDWGRDRYNRDDRGPPPSRDHRGDDWRRGERGGDRDRRDDRRDDDWGRGGSGRRDDRGPPPRDSDRGSAWRRDDRGGRDDREERDDRGGSRDDDGRDSRFRGMPRDIRLDEKEGQGWRKPAERTPAKEDAWRRGGPAESRSPPKDIRGPSPSREKPRGSPSGPEDDGWTTVRR